MILLFNCVDEDQYRVDMPDYDNVADFVDDIIYNKARWITDTENGVSIQVDKIISICEVRDE